MKTITDDDYRSMLELLETSEELGELHRLWQRAKTFHPACTGHQWKMLVGTCRITYDRLWPLPVEEQGCSGIRAAHWAYRPTPALPQETVRQDKLF